MANTSEGSRSNDPRAGSTRPESRGIVSAVRVAIGTVVAGKVVLEGEPLPDGARVTVLVPDGDDTFELSPEDEAELLSAIAEADRGNTVDAASVIASLPRRR